MQINYFDDVEVNLQQAKDSQDSLKGFRVDFFFGERQYLIIRYFFDEHLKRAISDYLYVMRGGDYAN